MIISICKTNHYPGFNIVKRKYKNKIKLIGNNNISNNSTQAKSLHQDDKIHQASRIIPKSMVKRKTVPRRDLSASKPPMKRNKSESTNKSHTTKIYSFLTQTTATK